jgi:5'-3' exonuclease
VKIHLVDGTFELFRCFNGAPRATNSAGEEVGASRAFAHTLVALLRRDDVTHVAVTFDTIVDAPLAPSTDDGPWNQHSIAAEITRALGIVMWPMIRRYEADDALASAAAKYAGEPEVDQIVICTRDKDLAQCVVGDRVVMLDRINDVVTNEEGVIGKWGVPPPLIPSLLALTGDKADGLPGLPGWGKKSAATVLNRYGSIEQIPASADDWEVPVRGATRLAAILAERRSEALLYRDLIDLATDVPLRQSVADLDWRGANREQMEGITARIGAEDAIPRVPRWR